MKHNKNNGISGGNETFISLKNVFSYQLFSDSASSIGIAEYPNSYYLEAYNNLPPSTLGRVSCYKNGKCFQYLNKVMKKINLN